MILSSVSFTLVLLYTILESKPSHSGMNLINIIFIKQMRSELLGLSVTVALAFCVKGQSQDIGVLRTIGTDIIEPAYIVLKEYKNGYKSCNHFEGGARLIFTGQWRREGDSLLLSTEYGFQDETLLPAGSFDPERYDINLKFIFRDQGFDDCTLYPEEHVVIDGDTVWSGTVRPNSFHATYYEERDYIKESLKFLKKRPLWKRLFSPKKFYHETLLTNPYYNAYMLLQPKRNHGFFLWIFPNFFEHYFPEKNESLSGYAELKNDTLSLRPLYVQRFDKDGEMEDIREEWKDVNIRFVVKGYSMKLAGYSDQQHAKYSFARKYDRYKQKSFPPHR
jgi:hypothetical protein